MRPLLIRNLFALLSACALAAACDQQTVEPDFPAVDISWKRIVTDQDDVYAVAVWASGSGDVYVGNLSSRGLNPSLAHYDGTSWQEVPLALDDGSSFHIWGSGASDVYVAGGQLHHFDGSSWSVEPISARWVTGSSSNQVYAAWSDVIYGFDGADWDTLRTFAGAGIRSLAAAPDGTLFVNLEGSQILSWNGVEWLDTVFPMTCVSEICAFAIDDAFALNFCGEDAIYHWNGVDWTLQTTSVEFLSDIDGTSATDVYATGLDGAVLRYDGSQWAPLPSPTSMTLRAISGTTSGIAVTSDEHKVMWFDGQDWQILREATPRIQFNPLYAESSTRFLVADSRSIFRYEDNAWSEIPLGFDTDDSFELRVFALSGRSLDDAYAIVDGRKIAHYDGERWTVEIDSLSFQEALWTSPGGIVYSVGEGEVYRRNPAWERIRSGPFYLPVVGGDGGEGVVAAGFNAINRELVHFDGTSWKNLPSPDPGIRAIWSGPGLDLYVAGSVGIHHWDGARFQRLPTPNRSFDTILFGTTDGRVIGLGNSDVAVLEDGIVGASRVTGASVATRAADGSILAISGRSLAVWRP